MKVININPDLVYPRIHVPLNKSLEQTTKAEAKAFLDWFIGNTSERIKTLEYFVNHELGNWTPDFSIRSLGMLGHWLKDTSKTRYVTSTEKEIEIERKGHPKWFADLIREIDTTLSIETLSRCFDTGIYFGEVLKQEMPELVWSFRSSPKSFIDFHHPILTKRNSNNKASMNPIRVTEVIAFKMIEGKAGSDELLKTCKTWFDVFST